MTSQLEIYLAGGAPEVTQAEVDAFCSWLRGRGWVRAAEIEAACGLDERKIRAIAEHSDGALLSGQKGYRLNDESATADEVNRSSGWLLAQGKKMIRRAMAQKRHHHRLLHQTLSHS
jgi:hypothetical protein